MSEEEKATSKLVNLISDYGYYVSRANSLTEIQEIAKERILPIEEMRDDRTPIGDGCREEIADELYFTLLEVSRRLYELNGKSELLQKGSLPPQMQKELRVRADSLVVGYETIGQIAEALITDKAEIAK